MSQRRASPPNRKRGFTLIELVLVLGLLVTLAVLAWPRMEQTLIRTEHRAAAEQIQSTLWRLRLEAIQTGCPQWFRYCPETSAYQVAALPYDEVEQVDFNGLPMGASSLEDGNLEDDPSAISAGSPSEAWVGSDGEETERMQLENGIVFLAPDSVQALVDPLENVDDFENLVPETEELAELEALLPEEELPRDESITGQAAEFRWSEPIVFYPDGQADQAHIYLKAPSGHIMEVTVSGMAGHVQIGPRQPPRDRVQEPDTSEIPDDFLVEP